MNNTAWVEGGDIGMQAVVARRAPRTVGALRPPAQERPRYSVVLAVPGAVRAADVIRDIVGLQRAELEWLSGNQPRHATRMHLRLRTERIDDLVTAFEAAGFEVVRVVTTGR